MRFATAGRLQPEQSRLYMELSRLSPPTVGPNVRYILSPVTASPVREVWQLTSGKRGFLRDDRLYNVTPHEPPRIHRGPHNM